MSFGKWLLVGLGASALFLGIFNPHLLRAILNEVVQGAARVILEIWNALAVAGFVELGLTLGVLFVAYKLFLAPKAKKK